MARVVSAAMVAAAIVGFRLMYQDGESALPWVGAWAGLSLVLVIAVRPRVALVVSGALVLVGGAALVGFKEYLRTHGELVFLPLDSVDTRAFVHEGDYRALRFTLSKQLEREVPNPPEGEHAFVWVALDDQHIGTGSVAPTTLKLRYLFRDGRIWLGTDGLFFKGDPARHFEQAHYGEFRVDPVSGEALFVGLRDHHLQRL
jgi:uncharacterized membrane-anchored protein